MSETKIARDEDLTGKRVLFRYGAWRSLGYNGHASKGLVVKNGKSGMVMLRFEHTDGSLSKMLIGVTRDNIIEILTDSTGGENEQDSSPKR